MSGADQEVRPTLAKLAQHSGLEIEDYALGLVVVGGVGVGDLGGREVELGQAELDDGAEAEVEAGLGEVQAQLRLVEELLGEGDAIVGGGGVQPGNPDVARDAVLQVGDILRGGFGLHVGFGLAGFEEAAVEDRDGDVDADRAVAAGDGLVGGGRETSGADDAEGRVVEGMLGLHEAFGSTLFEAQVAQLRAVVQGGAKQIADGEAGFREYPIFTGK